MVVVRSPKTRMTIMVLLLLSLSLFPISLHDNRSGPVIAGPDHTISIDGSALIQDTPYVWQEISGFCFWAAVTMALGGAEVPLTLHEFFAASGIGFSAAYIRFNDTMTFLAGSAYIQVGQLVPICDFYGLEQKFYLSETSPWVDTAIELWSQWNPDINTIHGWNDAFEIMKNTLDEGYPVVLWTDPYYLPPDDYQILRDYGLFQNTTAPVSGHAVLAIGYNDTSETVEILDPGVGAFGDDFGYPEDGRWRYTMNYSQLNNAWGAFAYGTTTIKPENGTKPDFQTELGEFVASRLLGAQESYIPFTDEDAFFLNFGEKAFRGLSYDITPEGVALYIEEYDNFEDQIDRLANLGMFLEFMLTLQYLSYRTALESLPRLLTDFDLTDFLVAGQNALTHLDALSDNGTLVDFDYLANHDSLLSNTFFEMVEEFDSSRNLDVVLENHRQDLADIAGHLLATADSWRAAGIALQAALESQAQPMSLILPLTGAFGVVVVLALVLRRRIGT
ncbi:MAG: BtrH N-terminal domain-containing protein [Candidatus Thorarchaeota archaeon]|nr:MAG: BtrH N-terminal domain-containing protein [Candidatus Thorarchaeota archaeon]